MLPQWIIEKKRDGKALSSEEIRWFIDGYTKGTIPDYQMSALAMAIYFKGMDPAEVSVLVDAMMRSGDLVDTSSIPLPKADKHSTGGIGDKVSLPLAPLVACFDIAVPMISGRGLGITGGTLDKLESIPGYQAKIAEKHFIDVIKQCGCSIIGQTDRLAPADKKLYALRDVTATVPSIPLITASIMCKKMAEGIDALVLDVKCGAGAFMKTREDARALAQSMINVGKAMNRKVSAIITDMNQPLGRTAGNALEVIESVETLRGRGPADLVDLTVLLAVEMIMLSYPDRDPVELDRACREKLKNGEALARFREMVRLQHGDVAAIDDLSRLPHASIVEEFNAPHAGYVAEVNAEGIGRACIVLGAGRKRTEDPVDFAVGISDLVKVGDRVEKGQPLLMIHANDKQKLAEAEQLIAAAFRFSANPVPHAPAVLETLR
ncbi:MAG TPA: thymidine phosphorylase [Kiritimatiellia bacterium]|nr:thymidine phosphorylase [Kiritimatiellia bacterium]HMP34635.1 thymidine phosphorylase [Kiritimatiellia bacterium]